MKRIGASAQLPLDSLTEDLDSDHAPERRNTTGSEPPIDKETYCLRRMRTLAACYRKDDTSNPEEYAAAGAAVLSEYTIEVVDVVTDPRSGLPSKINWLPTIKEIRDACEAEALRAHRIQQAQGQPRGKPVRREMLPVVHRATLFTPQGFPRYDELKARAEREKGHPCYLENRECLDGKNRYGIWTPYDWVAG